MSGGERYAISTGASIKEVGEVLAVYRRDRRALHVLNPTATLLFHCLDEPATIPELAQLMGRFVEAPVDTLERDLAAVIPELVRLELVRRVE